MVKNTNAMQNFFIMQEILISTPTDILYEIMIFEHYKKLLEILDVRMNQKTTLEDDIKELTSNNLDSSLYLAMVYRSEQKRIIKKQLNIVSKTLEVLQKAKEILKADYKSVEATE